jgi:hypothetical protein
VLLSCDLVDRMDLLVDASFFSTLLESLTYPLSTGLGKPCAATSSARGDIGIRISFNPFEIIEFNRRQAPA